MTLNINTSALVPLQGGNEQQRLSLRQSLSNITAKGLSSAEKGIKVSLPTDFNLRVTEAFTSKGIPKIAEIKLNVSVHKLDPQKVEALL